MEGPQPQSSLSLDMVDDQDCSPHHLDREPSEHERMTELVGQDEKKQVLDTIEGLIPGEVEYLKKENVRLKKEKDTLQEALIILAGSYLRA